jgi:hypothetical protein
VSSDRDYNDGGKGGRAGDAGIGSSKGTSRRSSSGGCSMCGGSRARGLGGRWPTLTKTNYVE